MPTSRSHPVLGLLLALATGVLVAALVQYVANHISPAPPDATQLRTALEAGEVPFISLALILCAWWLGAYSGGRVAARIGGGGWAVLGFTVLFTVAVVWQALSQANPLWLRLGGVLGTPLLAMGAAGDRIVLRTG